MFKNEDNALFVAPILKAGLIASTGKHRGITMDARNNNYGYWNSGIRFGHIRLDAKPKQVAPELLSFLDLTVGKFDNFRTPRRRPATGETLVGDQFNRDLRFEAHGRFKIPQTPMYLGFTGDLGPGPDDLRIFFGTRFDIGQLIGKALPNVQ